MRTTLLSASSLLFSLALWAQPKPATVQKPPVKTTAISTAGTTVVKPKPVPPVATKVLRRQMESYFTRKKYKQVLPIADTLLKRNRRDETAFLRKLSSEVMLKMDKQVIADLKKWHKNKDTAASMIATIPYAFDFRSKGRSSDAYYKAAMGWAPKNGVGYMMYSFELVEKKKMEEAVGMANKGYTLLNDSYKKSFVAVYGAVLFAADHKEEAYKLLEDEIAAGNTETEVVKNYFNFYGEDKRYDDGIAKATEYIAKDPSLLYVSRRALLSEAAGYSEKACEDAVLMKEKFDEGDYWLKRFNCPQIVADATPNAQRTYIYEVIAQGQKYDFRVSNPKVDVDNGVSFKFKMTGEVGINGVVNISKEAMATAHEQMNMFTKENFDLKDQTTVWISKEVFNELKTKGSSFINAETWTGGQEFEVVKDDENQEGYYPVTIDDQTKYVKCLKLSNKDGSQEMWITDDPKNPLILKMNLSFSIELKQIL